VNTQETGVGSGNRVTDLRSAVTDAACGLISIGVALLLPSGRSVLAQNPAEARVRFEVASIAANTSGTNNSTGRLLPGGRYTATNTTPQRLIRNAFGLHPFQIVDAPGWFTSERFDINAKADGNIAPEQLRRMLQTLLVERFKLTFHREMRDMPIYSLVRAHADGRLGPSLRKTSFDCAALFRGELPPPTPSTATARPVCGSHISAGAIVAGGMAMTEFAANLSAVAGRTVVDRTALTGAFDIDLSYAPDMGDAPVPSELPSVFTAVQEQLGLKLEAGRGTVEVVVIDGAERPAEN